MKVDVLRTVKGRVAYRKWLKDSESWIEVIQETVRPLPLPVDMRDIRDVSTVLHSQLVGEQNLMDRIKRLADAFDDKAVMQDNEPATIKYLIMNGTASSVSDAKRIIKDQKGGK